LTLSTAKLNVLRSVIVCVDHSLIELIYSNQWKQSQRQTFRITNACL